VRAAPLNMFTRTLCLHGDFSTPHIRNGKVGLQPDKHFAGSATLRVSHCHGREDAAEFLPLLQPFRDPNLLALHARVPGAPMAAEFEARHAAVIAIRALCVGPHAIGAAEQRFRPIRQMRSLETLGAGARAEDFAACAEQAADTGKQQIRRERLQEYAIASRRQGIGHAVGVGRGDEYRRRQGKSLGLTTNFHPISRREIELGDHESGCLAAEELSRDIEGTGGRNPVAPAQNGCVTSSVR